MKEFFNKAISCKKFIVVSVVFPLFMLLAMGFVMYLYDPLQIYHKPYFRNETFFADMRLSARGIIQNYNFDSYIIGTSMLENTDSLEANEKLGGNWVNISAPSSTFDERGVILDYLFRVKNPKSIIYSLDPFENAKYKNEFRFLYDENYLDDLKVYVNKRFILCAMLWQTSVNCVGKEDLFKLTRWGLDIDFRNMFGGVENWLTYNRQEAIKYFKNIKIEPFEPKDKIHDFTKLQNLANNSLIKYIKQNPQTKFHLIIPTYSKFHYRVDSKDAFIKNREFYKWLIVEISKYPNAYVYGFDDLDYADNIESYRDSEHYDMDLNSMHLDSIRDKTNILTPSNMETYFQIMERKIKNYNADKILDFVLLLIKE